MSTQQLERDVYQPPAFIAAYSCVECGSPCLPSERSCFRCQLIAEDIEAEHHAELD